MGRAERRRAEKRKIKSETRTYNFTEQQLRNAIHEGVSERIGEIRSRAAEEAANTALALMLALPLEVLMDHYWQKSYRKRIPEFTERVLEYYRRWQDGELDMDKLKADLWEYGGVKLEETDRQE